MKVRIEKDKLADAVAWAMRGLSSSRIGGNNTIGIEAGVGTLTLVAYDRDTSAQAEADAAVDVPGSVIVPGKLLAEITKTLPSAAVQLSVVDGALRVECGKSSFDIPLVTVGEFPHMLEVPGLLGTINGSQLSVAISQVAIAAASNDTLSNLSGIHFEFTKSHITLAATDRYRLALRDVEWTPATTDMNASAFIPAAKVNDIAKGLADCTNVDISLSTRGENSLVGFSGNNRTIATTLLNAKFPNYRDSIPAPGDITAYIDNNVLAAALRRVRLVLEEREKSFVSMELGTNEVILTARGQSSGVATETIDAIITGKTDEPVRFDPFRFTEGLTATNSPWVKLSFINKSKPVLLTAAKEAGKDIEDGYKYWLMPKLYN